MLAFQSIVCIFQIIKREGNQVEAKNSSFGIHPDSLPSVEFQPCTGRKVGWGREGGSAAPEQGQLPLPEAAGKPLSSSAALTDPGAINTSCPAGVLGEQHASRLCSRHEPAQPSPLLSLAEKGPKAIPSLALVRLTWQCPGAEAPELPELPECSSSILASCILPQGGTTASPFTAALGITKSQWPLLRAPFSPSDTCSNTLREHHTALESWEARS